MSEAPGFPGGFPHDHGKGKGRAIDLDDVGSSHIRWLFCFDCGQYVSNSVDCFQNNHCLFDTAMADGSHPLPQDVQDEFQFSGRTEPSTHFSGRSDLFSTLDSGMSFNTVDSLFDSNDLLMDGATSHRQVFDPAIPIDSQVSEDWAVPEHPVHGGAQDVDMVDNEEFRLTGPQQETLDFWLRRCERERRRPSEMEIQSIAALEHLSIDTVISWFHARQPMRGADPDTASGAANDEMPPFEAAPPDPEVLLQVSEYAARRARDDGACSNAQSRKADAGRYYRCTVGCNFSTDDLDTWRRHLRNRFPQQFWHCVLCRANRRKPFINHRRDKIFQHLENVHSAIHHSQYERLRNESEILHEGRYPSRCPFENKSCTCPETFQSWNEFIQHCLYHFKERNHDGPWQIRFKYNAPEDDDDNANGGPSNTSSSGNAWSGFKGPSLSAKAESSSHAGYKTTKGASRTRDLWREDNLRARPSTLIDVRSYQIVSPPQQEAKWLALDYSWASKRCEPSRLSYKPDALAQIDGRLERSQLPTPFRRAILLTREMGYRYLWIDVLCDPIEYAQKQDAIYKQAALIIVIVGSRQSPDHIWHFTCDYRNLHTVLSWAHDRIWNYTFDHLRNLGQGAYGIVDEVRLGKLDEDCLRPRRQTFARKVLLSRQDGRALQPRYLQEIEILQKFDHPNIPKFVAAYVQRQSLNILMLPVAECDLRELLSRPRSWAHKLMFLPGWFVSLAHAIEYMHSLSCRHKDIKPANILISGQDVLLSDFGTSHDFSTSDSGSNGPGFMTPKYCAPEVAQKQQRGRKADIFSLGCVFLEMITICLGQPLKKLSEHLGFKSNAHDVHAVYHRQINGMHAWLKYLTGLESSPYQKTIIRVTAEMLNEMPSKRPTAADIRKALTPEILLTAVPSRQLVSRHSSKLKPLRRGRARTRRSSRMNLSTESFGPKTSAPPLQELSNALNRIKSFGFSLVWSLLDGSRFLELSMVVSDGDVGLQHAAVSITCGYRALSERLTHCTKANRKKSQRVSAKSVLCQLTASTLSSSTANETSLPSSQSSKTVPTPFATSTAWLVALCLVKIRASRKANARSIEHAPSPRAICDKPTALPGDLALPCSSLRSPACQEYSTNTDYPQGSYIADSDDTINNSHEFSDDNGPLTPDVSVTVDHRAPLIDENNDSYDYSYLCARSASTTGDVDHSRSDLNEEGHATGSDASSCDEFVEHDEDGEDGEEFLIEVGDFGLIPIADIMRALGRHDHCTCHNALDVIQGEDDYSFTTFNSPSASGFITQADSESIIVESGDQNRGSSQVLSISSRGSSLLETVGVEFCPIFRPLSLTPEVHIDNDISLSGCIESDMW